MSRPSVLVYRALGLGDLLTAVPALRALKDAFADHRLVLACPSALEPLAMLSGAVDRVLATSPLAVPALAGAELAVNLHGRGPESHRAILASRPGRLIAFESPDVPWHGPEWRAGEHEVARWCRLLDESGIAADPTRLDLPAPAQHGNGCAVPGASVVHPGAGSPSRRWPADRWAAVARAEREAGRRVVVTGSAAERPLAERIAYQAGLGASDVLAGRTGLIELAAVVASAGRVLCGDTGVGHLATAFGVPSVLLFGPTPPSEWGPPRERTQHVVLHRGACGDPHAETPDPGLLAITVADVLAVTRGRFPPVASGSRGAMGITDKITGRVKKAVGDLTDDASLRQQGRKEQRKGEAKEQQARAEERAQAKAEEVRNLERQT